MTIPLTTSPGGLFTRLGKIGKLIADVNSFQNSTMQPDLTAIYNQYDNIANSEPDIAAPLESSEEGIKLAAANVVAQLQSMAIATVTRMVYRDSPQPDRGLLTAMNEVIRQMIITGDTVKASTITIANAADGANTGNGVVAMSTKDGNGLVQENTFTEVGKLACTADSYTGGVTAGNESFQWRGDAAQSSVFHFDWPLGSGLSATLSAIQPSGNNSLGNLLNNSDFEDFTVANTPDKWVINVGAAGTDVFKSTASFYDGIASMEFRGGATLTAVSQTFNLSTGTVGRVVPFHQYSLGFFLKMSSAPGAGVLVVELVDGSGAVINDAQGVANSMTVNLVTAPTSFTFNTMNVRLPRVLPAVVKLRFRLSTALSGGSSAFIDHAALGEMTQLYSGGPSLALFSASTNFVKDDKFNVTTTNDRGGATNLKTFQALFDRCFGMKQFKLLLPSSGSPTIADSLIG